MTIARSKDGATDLLRLHFSIGDKRGDVSNRDKGGLVSNRDDRKVGGDPPGPKNGLRPAVVTFAVTFAVTLVDCGYDFQVSFDSPLDEASLQLQLGAYLVEVKATTVGPVRLTPAQAQMSVGEPARFVLCVVDLRGVPFERLDEEWDGNDVEPLMHLVSGIGTTVASTWSLVDEARRSEIGIRNDATLRYEVPTSSWESGSRLHEWIAAALAT